MSVLVSAHLIFHPRGGGFGGSHSLSFFGGPMPSPGPGPGGGLGGGGEGLGGSRRGGRFGGVGLDGLSAMVSLRHIEIHKIRNSY